MAILKRKTNNGYEPLPAMVVRKTNAENGNGIGTCSTSSGTALEVVLSDYNLVQNGFVAVTFSNDVPANATLNVNSKGAKPIVYKGSAITADTIKADDTVMFCYDGTNYVVTSLGGGGSSIVFPEFVTIQLTQSEGSDSDLIGATVVVTNDDTSATILSTTWQGSAITVQVDAGVDYTVTVGNVSGLAIRQNTQSYTAVSGLARTINFKYWGNVVDLGLPSGVLWASGNIVIDVNDRYKVGNETDYGAYVSWGNVTPHFSSNGSTYDDGYDFGTNNSGPYASTPGSSLSGNIASNDAVHDAVLALLGTPWHLPTKENFKELYNNTDGEWTTVNGVNGWKFMKKTDHSVYVFFPAVGRGEGTSLIERGSKGRYWSSSLSSADNAYLMFFDNGKVITQDNYYRYLGYSIRAVQ